MSAGPVSGTGLCSVPTWCSLHEQLRLLSLMSSSRLSCRPHPDVQPCVGAVSSLTQPDYGGLPASALSRCRHPLNRKMLHGEWKTFSNIPHQSDSGCLAVAETQTFSTDNISSKTTNTRTGFYLVVEEVKKSPCRLHEHSPGCHSITLRIVCIDHRSEHFVPLTNTNRWLVVSCQSVQSLHRVSTGPKVFFFLKAIWQEVERQHAAVEQRSFRR